MNLRQCLQCDLEEYPYDEDKLNQFCQEHGFIGWYECEPYYLVANIGTKDISGMLYLNSMECSSSLVIC